jgi:hypothetical protein
MLIGSLLLQWEALFFMALLTFIYFSKKRLSNAETKIYAYLILLTDISEDVKKNLTKHYNQIYSYFGFNFRPLSCSGFFICF